jgi:hypothetical protein
MFDFNTDDSFDIEKTDQYKLSIQVSLDGFSFLIVHPSEKKIVAFKSTPLKISSKNLIVRRLKEWLESEDFFKKPFNEVRVFIFTEIFTIIPDECYSGENQHDLQSVLFDQETGYSLVENNIEILNARLYFPIQSEITEVLQLLFDNAECIHPVTKLLQIPLYSNKRNCAVIVSMKQNFYLIVKRNNKLLLANSFQVSHQDDLVYNVLNAFQQLETARSETELFITDVLSNVNEIKGLLQPYFGNISTLNTAELTVNPDIFEHQLLLYLSQN